MTDRERLDLLRGALLSGRSGGDVSTPSCLDDETIAALAEGVLDEPQARETALRHLADCASCRTALASVAGALENSEVRREMAVVEHSRRRFYRIVVPAAAAAALVLLLLPRPESDHSQPGIREASRSDSGAPVLIAPRATVTAADRLIWSSVPAAFRYRLRLHDAEGAVLWNGETSDTVVALPDSVKLASGSRYFWRVEAETEWHRWIASDLVEFTIVETSR